MKYGLGLPLPEDYAQRVDQFRLEWAAWEIRSMRSDPHVSIKGPAGLSENDDALVAIIEVVARIPPFVLQLTAPAMFEPEPILYLGVNSPGWWHLHRALVDAIAARTGAEMHPWEISGWIPHATILRTKPDLRGQKDVMIEAASRALAPFPAFVVTSIRMYGQTEPTEHWHRVRDFSLG